MSVNFNHTPVDDEQKALMKAYGVAYQALYDSLQILPKNTALSIAFTRLEESNMWVNKSITNNC